jgi:hypothetical protein
VPKFRTPVKKPSPNVKCDVTGKQIGCQDVSATLHCGLKRGDSYRVVNLNLSQEVADQIIKFLKEKYKCSPDMW